jgi:adenosylcobyric acid synthase
MTARPLFVGGTSSNAGKSWMVTAICAWLRQQGVSVAPFKAQNMSNNSYPCRAGGEIGRAQVAQAEACGLEPEPAMNPILLKPSGNGASQVIVNGRMWKTLTARQYYAHTPALRAVVRDAYDDLASRHQVVVIEGAGSVSELNLRAHDLVNLDLVTSLGAPWILVADIERGGVFGSVAGTVHLLTAEERALFRGFAINRFRGDLSLFDEGVRILEERTGSPCLGVFPFEPGIFLDQEDSLAVNGRRRTPPPPGCRLALVKLPHLSNSTDFRLLTWAEWLAAPPPDHYDVIVLPGSKNTIDDLRWLRQTGLADWLLAEHRRGATVLGICGGYQMMGRSIADPLQVESSTMRAEGLGLLPVDTELTAVKRTRAVAATTPAGVAFGGYEIHTGVTTIDPGSQAQPFARLEGGEHDGIRTDRVIGTYLHGALEHPGVCAELLGVELPGEPSKAEHYLELARWFERHVRHLDALGLDRR